MQEAEAKHERAALGLPACCLGCMNWCSPKFLGLLGGLEGLVGTSKVLEKNKALG